MINAVPREVWYIEGALHPGRYHSYRHADSTVRLIAMYYIRRENRKSKSCHLEAW